MVSVWFLYTLVCLAGYITMTGGFLMTLFFARDRAWFLVGVLLCLASTISVMWGLTVWLYPW